MIARLRGRVEALREDHAIIGIGGVGLQVHAPTPLLESWQGARDEVEIFTHLVVRENDISLYGFGSEEELKLFKLLLTVSGVGPRAALAILSHTSLDSLQMAIAQERAEILAGVPGIGIKTAKKIVLHLKDKVEAAMAPALPPALIEADAEVIGALTSLGYSLLEAQRAVQSVPPEVTDVEERLRLALGYFTGT